MVSMVFPLTKAIHDLCFSLFVLYLFSLGAIACCIFVYQDVNGFLLFTPFFLRWI